MKGKSFTLKKQKNKKVSYNCLLKYESRLSPKADTWTYSQKT